METWLIILLCTVYGVCCVYIIKLDKGVRETVAIIRAKLIYLIGFGLIIKSFDTYCGCTLVYRMDQTIGYISYPDGTLGYYLAPIRLLLHTQIILFVTIFLEMLTRPEVIEIQKDKPDEEA